ncbi:hypothetical protein QE381_003441 [Microbacterium sp. SORGH_AS 888]|nr:hypothetical protein [Microbacterium sp. SORGH_AS_0888]
MTGVTVAQWRGRRTITPERCDIRLVLRPAASFPAEASR